MNAIWYDFNIIDDVFQLKWQISLGSKRITDGIRPHNHLTVNACSASLTQLMCITLIIVVFYQTCKNKVEAIFDFERNHVLPMARLWSHQL